MQGYYGSIKVSSLILSVSAIYKGMEKWNDLEQWNQLEKWDGLEKWNRLEQWNNNGITTENIGITSGINSEVTERKQSKYE